MRAHLLLPVLLVGAAGCFGAILFGAAHRPTGPATAGDELVDISATALIDKPSVVQALGTDPQLPLILINVKLAPKGDTKIKVYLDDFTLLSSSASRDFERVQPLSPGQIAGKGSIRVTGTGAGTERRVRLGGFGIGQGADGAAPKATVQKGIEEKENPLLGILKEKVLPEKETNEPVSGYLYFLLDGKTPKLKDLSLVYKGPAGRLLVEFR